MNEYVSLLNQLPRENVYEHESEGFWRPPPPLAPAIMTNKYISTIKQLLCSCLINMFVYRHWERIPSVVKSIILWPTLKIPDLSLKGKPPADGKFHSHKRTFHRVWTWIHMLAKLLLRETSMLKTVVCTFHPQKKNLVSVDKGRGRQFKLVKPLSCIMNPSTDSGTTLMHNCITVCQRGKLRRNQWGETK